MRHLPDDFAETLARVIEPGDRDDAGYVIDAATRLDDEGLRLFLEMFAARVRASAAPVRREELRGLLTAAARGGRRGRGAP